MFNLGTLVMTPGADQALAPSTVRIALDRHSKGDWGVVDGHDRTQNDRAVGEGARILSVYEEEGTRFYVITEADRSATTVLLPEEY